MKRAPRVIKTPKREVSGRHTENPGYKPGNHWVVCDQCGLDCRNFDMMLRWDNAVVCPMCWEPRHEQDFVRARKDRIKPTPYIRPPYDLYADEDLHNLVVPYVPGPGVDPDPPPPPYTPPDTTTALDDAIAAAVMGERWDLTDLSLIGNPNDGDQVTEWKGHTNNFSLMSNPGDPTTNESLYYRSSTNRQGVYFYANRDTRFNLTVQPVDTAWVDDYDTYQLPFVFNSVVIGFTVLRQPEGVGYDYYYGPHRLIRALYSTDPTPPSGDKQEQRVRDGIWNGSTTERLTTLGHYGGVWDSVVLVVNYVSDTEVEVYNISDNDTTHPTNNYTVSNISAHQYGLFIGITPNQSQGNDLTVVRAAFLAEEDQAITQAQVDAVRDFVRSRNGENRFDTVLDNYTYTRSGGEIFGEYGYNQSASVQPSNWLNELSANQPEWYNAHWNTAFTPDKWVYGYANKKGLKIHPAFTNDLLNPQLRFLDASWEDIPGLASGAARGGPGADGDRDWYHVNSPIGGAVGSYGRRRTDGASFEFSTGGANTYSVISRYYRTTGSVNKSQWILFGFDGPSAQLGIVGDLINGTITVPFSSSEYTVLDQGVRPLGGQTWQFWVTFTTSVNQPDYAVFEMPPDGTPSQFYNTHNPGPDNTFMQWMASMLEHDLPHVHATPVFGNNTGTKTEIGAAGATALLKDIGSEPATQFIWGRVDVWTLASSTTTNNRGFIVYVADDLDNDAFGIYMDGDGFGIYKKVNGQGEAYQSYALAYTIDTKYDIRYRIDDVGVDMWIDGTKVLSITSPNAPWRWAFADPITTIHVGNNPTGEIAQCGVDRVFIETGTTPSDDEVTYWDE